MEGNLISGNNDWGIEFAQAGTLNNVVAGNRIGTDVSGLLAIPNGTASLSRGGIWLGSVANRIGTNEDSVSDELERNLISGNNGTGILVNLQIDSAAVPNLIAGNYIGADAGGLAALPNTGSGLSSVVSPTFNYVIRGNVISGNGGGGITIGGLYQAVITGNLIGVGSDGTTPMGNTGGPGISMGGSDNQIGGAAPGDGNTIANNSADGVALLSWVRRTSIRGNRIYANSGLGIDLNDNGVTLNDAGDGDTGANELQNFPVLTGATSYANGETVIQGTLDSLAGTTFTIDVYSSAAADGSGYGEGETYHGAAQVTTDGGGLATFEVTLAGVTIAAARWVAATATDPDGNTSEFSLAIGPTGSVQDVPITGLSALVGTPVYVGTAAAFSAGVAAGTNVSYQWDFGDGGMDVGASAQHTYLAGGEHTATVTASNSSSSGQASLNVIVIEPANVNGVVWYDKDEDGFFGLGESSHLHPGGAVVTATLVQDPQVSVSDVRDNNGYYQILVPQAGTWVVAVDRDLWHATSPNPFSVVVSTDGGVRIDFGMNLNPSPGTGRINGRAWLDGNGSGFPDSGETPLSGLTVTLRDAGGVLSTSTTDGAGWINIPALAPGTYWVDVAAPAGVYPTIRTNMVTVVAGLVVNSHAPFSLGGGVSGQVNGQSGVGVGGVALTLMPDNLQVTTAADGGYNFAGLAAGDRTLHIDPGPNFVTPDGVEQRLVPVVLNNGAVENWSLLRRGRLMVKATQVNNGQVLPVGNMFFELLQSGTVVDFVMTDLTGQVVIDGLTPGTYTARPFAAAVLPGSLVNPAERTATVTYDSAATLAFSFNLARSVSLHCRLAGESPPNGFACQYEIRNSTGSLIDTGALTAANPSTTLWNLNPATLGVHLIPDVGVPGQGSWPTHSQVVVLDNSTHAHVYYPFNPANPQTINGYAFWDRCVPVGIRGGSGTCNETNAGSNNGLTVTLETAAGAVIATTQTSNGTGYNTGYFEFPDTPIGAYRVAIALPPGYTATTATQIAVTLDGVANSEQLAFGYQRVENGLITGRVFVDMDSNGQYGAAWDDALAGKAITVTTADGQPVASLTTASDGSFSLSPVGGGSYRVSLDHANQTITKAAAVLDSNVAAVVEFPLPPLTTRPRVLVFVDSDNNGVVDEGEQRLSDVYVDLLGLPCRETGALVQNGRTDAGGLAEFDTLPNGDGTVCARVSAGLGPELYPASPSGVVVHRGVGQPVPLSVLVAGTLRVRLFWDANGNAQKDGGEPLVSGGTATIAGTTQAVASGGTTFLLQPGSYDAMIVPPAGYLAGTSLPLVVVVEGATAQILPVPLRIEGGIGGVVTSPDGVGVGLTVELENLATGQTLATTTTANAGGGLSTTTFAFNNLNSGTYRLRLPVPPAGYKAASEPLVSYVAGAAQTENLALIYAGSVGGRRYFALYGGPAPGDSPRRPVALVDLSNGQVITQEASPDGVFLFDGLQGTTPYALTVPNLTGYKVHHAPGWFMAGAQNVSHDVGTTMAGNVSGFDSLSATVFYTQGNTRIPIGGVLGIYYAAVGGSCDVANPTVREAGYSDAQGKIWFLDYEGSGDGCARVVDVYGFSDSEPYLISCDLPGATCSDAYGGGYSVQRDFELIPLGASDFHINAVTDLSWSAFRDDNGNREWDAVETGIQGAMLTGGSATATSGPDGTAVLAGLPPGIHSATITPPPGFEVNGPTERTLAPSGNSLRLPPIPLRPAGVTTLTAFVDLDGDGLLGTIEHGLGGVVFDLNGPASASGTTLPDGRAMLAGLPDGAYTVTVTPPAGFAPAAPFALVLLNGGAAAAPLRPAGLVSGILYEDWDGDGTRRHDEPVHLSPVDLTLDNGSATVAALATAGQAIFTGVASDSYMLTSPFSLVESTSVVVPASGSLGVGLPIVAPGRVLGTAWLDADQDGVRAPWETPLSGVSVTVAGQTVTTDDDGRYIVFGLDPGSYNVAVALPNGLTATVGQAVVGAGRGAVVPIAAQAGADIVLLAVTADDGDVSTVPGGTVTYTLGYSNFGTAGAAGVAITEIVPAHTTFAAGSSTPGWVCTPDITAGSVCTLVVGIVPAGGVGSVDFALTVVSPVPAGVTEISNTAAIDHDGSGGSDPDPSDNTATETTPVEAVPDLAVIKTDGGVPIAPGANLVYTLSFANHGDQGATGVALSDTVPANTSFDPGSSSPGWICSPDGSAGSVCTLPGRRPRGRRHGRRSGLRRHHRRPGAAGVTQIVNTATVADDGGNGADADPSDNADTIATDFDSTPPTVANLDSVAGTGDGQLEDCETAHGISISSFVVSFSEAGQDLPGDTGPDDVTNPANYLVVGAGADHEIDTSVCGAVLGDDLEMAIATVTYDQGTTTAMVDLTRALDSSLYRVLACGSTTIVDLAGVPLDGDGDGAGGDDFARTFRVDRNNLFANGHFDCSIEDWTIDETVPFSVLYSTLDADGSTLSGSAAVSLPTATGSPESFSLGQCVPMAAGSLAAMGSAPAGGRRRRGSPSITPWSVSSSPTRRAAARAWGWSEQSAVVSDTAGVWMAVELSATAPSGNVSARCRSTLATSNGSAFDAYMDHVLLENRPLFADGFESGTTGSWSGVTP